MPSNSITPIIDTYTVDLASNNNYWFVTGVQGDGWATRYVDILLVNNGQPYEINVDAVNIMIRGTKPDNNQILNLCEIIDNNTIRVEITPQMAAVPGDGKYQISIVDKSENRVLTSFPFLIKIFESTFDFGYVVSSNEFGVLVEKINQADKMEVSLKEAIEEAMNVIEESRLQTNNCLTATDNINALNSSVSLAEEERKTNEEQRQETFSNTVTSLENARQDTIAATNEANTATQESQAATAAAIKATEDALKAIENVQNALGIDDTQESTTTVWSSVHTHNIITQDIENAIEESKKIFYRYKIPNITINISDWTNNVVYIKNEHINSDSVIDIYYNNDYLEFVEDFDIAYSQGDGYICFTSHFSPYNPLQIDAIMIENYSNTTIGTVSNSI